MTLDEKRADLAQKIASMTEKQFQEFMRLFNEKNKSSGLTPPPIELEAVND